MFYNCIYIFLYTTSALYTVQFRGSFSQLTLLKHLIEQRNFKHKTQLFFKMCMNTV